MPEPTLQDVSFRALLDAAPEATLLVNSAGAVRAINVRGQALFGWTEADLSGQPIDRLIPPRFQRAHVTQRAGQESGLATSVPPSPVVGFARRKDGSEMPVEISQSPLGSARDALMVVTIRDLTEWRRAQDILYHQKEQAVVTLESMGEGILTTDQKGAITYLNPVAERLTGWRAAEALGQPLDSVLMLIADGTRLPVQNMAERCLNEGRVVDMPDGVLLLRRDGTEVPVSDTAAPITDRNGATVGAVIVFHDVTENRRVVQRLSHAATHDPLTGLVNRGEFERRLARVISDAANDPSAAHALCVLDLDGFKQINDSGGHDAGDGLLREISAQLGREMRRRDTLARFGGDEFAVLFEHCAMPEAEEIATKLAELVRTFHFAWKGKGYSVGVSIGLAPITSESGRMAAVMRAADEACFAAKESGGNQVRVNHERQAVTPPREVQSRRANRLMRAVAENQFELYCQSIIPLHPPQRERPRCEILLRLPDEHGGLLNASAFLPQAERYHLMPSIERWMVTRTTAMLGEWVKQHPKAVVPLCAINLTSASLNEEFVGLVVELFQEHHLAPDSICFEISESVATANFARAAHMVARLRVAGCKVALEEFGGSMTSFTFLKSLPVDFVKFGGHYVRGVVDDPVHAALVGALCEISTLMGIATIAEEVDSPAALDKLRALGVSFAQGNAVARPEPFIATDGLLGMAGRVQSA